MTATTREATTGKTMNRVAILDTEATGLHTRRRAWEIGLITRPPTGDMEHHWFIHPADLDWQHRDPAALDIGHFWDRHPHAEHLRLGGSPWAAPERPDVVRLGEAAAQVALLTGDRTRIAGSNPAFDMEVLGRAMAEVAITPGWHYHPDDVPNMIRGWLRGRGRPLPARPTSEALCRAIGVDPDQYERHTALGDCRMFRDAYDLVDVAGPPCTSFAAIGCPACGNCRCTDDMWRCDPACTLHAPWSLHGAHDRAGARTAEMIRNDAGLHGCARGA